MGFSMTFFELWTRQILKGDKDVSKVCKSEICPPGANYTVPPHLYSWYRL